MIAHGVVVAARGGMVEARIPGAAIGDGVSITGSGERVTGVVMALSGGHAIVAAHDSVGGVARGDEALLDASALLMPLGMALLGRAVDARGAALDGGAPPRGCMRSLELVAPLPAERAAVCAPFWTGVRAIDGMLTLGRGARVGVFGPPGAGKSTLLHALMRGSCADAVVVGLVGERGREAEEWMRAAPAHAALVCATGDRSAAERVRAARVAMAQAAALRSRGLHVLLIVDSLARYAAALRELTVAAGEPAGRGGYPASVFAQMARYVEVAGPAQRGSITLVATVLSDGDERDPVSDAARSLLDGHIQLDASLARAGRFPAIDVPASASRTMAAVVSAGHAEDAALLRRATASLAQSAEARALGIVPADGFLQNAAALEPDIEAFLRQGSSAEQPVETLSALAELADRLR